jgi:hypothetical protein
MLSGRVTKVLPPPPPLDECWSIKARVSNNNISVAALANLTRQAQNKFDGAALKERKRR